MRFKLPPYKPEPYRLPIDHPYGKWWSWKTYREMTCLRCNKPFLARGNEWTNIRFCSDACQQEDRRLRRKEARREASEERSRKQSKCAICGSSMDWTRQTRRYCSDACRQRAYRQRTNKGEQHG